MGTQGNKVAEPPSPRKLLSAFTGGSIVFWIFAAALIHAVFIGSLSVGYIRDTWIDPEGARLRKEAIEAANKERKELEDAKRRRIAKAAASNEAALASAASNAAHNAANSNANASVTNTAAGTDNDMTGIPADRQGAKVIRDITSKASSNEIPKQPDMGITIEETNPKN